MTEAQQLGVYEFDSYRLDVVERTLWTGNRRLDLNGRAFDVLAALVRRAGKLVTKDELFQVAWHGRVVEEGNLHVQISNLRKVLGRKAITTVSRYGYRLEMKNANHPQDPAKASGNIFNYQLPTPFTTYITRAEEESSVISKIIQARLITLKGIGGIGKTRLALEACRQLESLRPELRYWFLSVSTLSRDEFPVIEHPGDVNHIAPHTKTSTSTPDHIKLLREQPTLLLIDSCELEITKIASFVRHALESCPELRIICTSRQSLGLLGEAVYEVPPLNKEVSKSLLVDRAPDFLGTNEHWSDEDHILDQVLEKLDGIPLALELAGSRLQTMGLKDLNQHLTSLLTTLTVNDLSVPLRHRALRATLDLSYQLLSKEEQELLNFLCLFSASFSSDAIKSMVVEKEHGVGSEIAQLTKLADKSMIAVGRGATSGQYRIQKSVREYGLENLERSGLRAQAQFRHACYMRDLIRQASESYHLLAWRSYYLPMLQEQWPNFEDTLHWTLNDSSTVGLDLGGELAAMLIHFWVDTGRLKDAINWLKVADERSVSDNVRLSIKYALGCALSEAGDVSGALTPLKEAYDGYLASEADGPNLAMAANELGVAMVGLQRAKEARVYFQLASEIFKKHRIKFREGQAVQNIAAVDFADGNIDACEARLEIALAINRSEGNSRSTSTCLMWLAECSYLKSSYPTAFRFISESKQLQPASPTDLTSSIVFYRFARCAAMVGSYETAGRAANVAIAALVELGHKHGIADCLDSIAVIGATIGEKACAAKLLGEVSAWRQKEAGPRTLLWASYFAALESDLLGGVSSTGSGHPLPPATDVAYAIELAKKLTRAAIQLKGP